MGNTEENDNGDLNITSRVSDETEEKQRKGKKKAKGNGKSVCHINRKTLPLKITLFLYYGAMSAILPYLTIHMKDIGISLSQIAIIYAVLPFTSFVGPPIMGFLADKFGQYKSVLIVATILNGVFHTLLLTVPKYDESFVFAPAVIEFQSTSQGGATILRPSTTSQCDSFYRSLLLSSSENKNQFRNQIINVHNCTRNNPDDRLSIGGVFSRGIDAKEDHSKPEISELCQMETAIRVEYDNNNEDADDDEEKDMVIYKYTCGNIFAPPEFPEFTKESKTTWRNKRATHSSAGKCSLKIQINSGNVPEIHSGFVCQTNYTFPTNEKIKNGNGHLTFWLYFLIRIIANLFMNACFALLDATALAIVGRNEGAEYGRERILCTIGFATISPLAGLIVDQVSKAKGYTDYSSSFYLSNALLVLNVIAYFFMELEVEIPEDDIWKNATDLLNYPEVVVFLGMIFIIGNMWGFVESYLFIFLDELSAPKYLLGLTLTVGSLAGIPFLYGAENLVAKAGRVNIIVLAFLVYFVRFFGYSYIPNPFWCFPFEAMEAFTFHLMWVSAATYCATLAPKGLLATLTGVMGSLHYGLGKGSGAFIGGYVISISSTRLAFRYFGIVAGVTGVVYFLINKFWLEGAIHRRNEREKEERADTRDQKQAMIP